MAAPSASVEVSASRDTAATASGTLVAAGSRPAPPTSRSVTPGLAGVALAWATWPDGRPSVDAAMISSAAMAATSRHVATRLSTVVKEYLDGTIDPSTRLAVSSERPLGWRPA
jgi:hypothetical protein